MAYTAICHKEDRTIHVRTHYLAHADTDEAMSYAHSLFSLTFQIRGDTTIYSRRHTWYHTTVSITSNILFYGHGSLGEVFAHGGEFPLSFLIFVGLGHGVENYSQQ